MTERAPLGQVVVLEFKQFGVHKGKSFPRFVCDEECRGVLPRCRTMLEQHLTNSVVMNIWPSGCTCWYSVRCVEDSVPRRFIDAPSALVRSCLQSNPLVSRSSVAASAPILRDSDAACLRGKAGTGLAVGVYVAGTVFTKGRRLFDVGARKLQLLC